MMTQKASYSDPPPLSVSFLTKFKALHHFLRTPDEHIFTNTPVIIT